MNKITQLGVIRHSKEELKEAGININHNIHSLMIGRTHGVPFDDSEGNFRFKNLSNIKDIEIVFVDKNEGKEYLITLSPKLKKNLIEYLKNRINIEKDKDFRQGIDYGYFDCIDFLFFLNGWNSNKRLSYKKVGKKYKMESGECFRIGSKGEKSGFHVVIYVGMGLFLSKIGAHSISINELNEFSDLYNTDEIYLIT